MSSSQTILARVEQALQAHGSTRQGESNGSHMWTCPVHETAESKASLAVGVGDSGKVVLFCHVCGEEATPRIVKTLGLTMSDLKAGVDWAAGPEATYDYFTYTNGKSRYAFSVFRFPGKQFVQGRKDAQGDGVGRFTTDWRWYGREGVRWGLDGREPVLFKLRDLSKALAAGKDVYIVEGEADVLALRKQRLAATCNPGGAGKWRPEFSQVFAGSSSRVLVVPDWDTAANGYKGQAHALAVAGSLVEVGLTVEFRRAKVGKDVRDHLSAGHNPDDLVPVSATDLADLVARASDVERERRVGDLVDKLVEREEAQRRFLVQKEAGRLVLPPTDSLADMLAAPREPRRELIEGLHGWGHNSGLTAQFKTGKTTLLGNLLSSLIDSYPFLGRFPVEPLTGNVALFNYEMEAEDMLDWLEALGIRNGHRVFVYNLRGARLSLANDSHAEVICDWLIEHEIQAWLVDPRRRAMRGFGDENENADVDTFTDTIDRIKAEAHVPNCFITAHTGRAQAELGEEHARGATSWDDWCDNRWILTKDAEGHRYFRSEGRLPPVEEFALAYNSSTRGIGATNNRRSDMAVLRVLGEVEEYVRDHPGCSQRNVQDELTGKKEVLVKALRELEKRGQIRVEKSNNGHAHYAVGAPDD